MTTKTSFWQRIGLQDWFLKKENTDANKKPPAVTPNDVFRYITEKFKESIGQLSFANRIVFFHEYIICFNPVDYRDFMDNKKGIFGLIVQESVKNFYQVLEQYRNEGKTVQPSSSKWVFRFVSHPDYPQGDISFIGKLLTGATQKEENLRVTYIPRQTGIAKTFDINPDILKGFTFYSEGYFEVPYDEHLVYDEKKVNTSAQNILARFETILPDKAYAGQKIEYLMKDEEIIVSGNEESRDASHIFRIPSEWVNTPHLRIRYNRSEDKFYLSSFGEKTIVNEKEVRRSDAAKPLWVALPVNSKIVLNGIVGINIFKS
ncbi:MAG: hypothetical protein ICV51_16785 [Flavisolibacter sp.]|nr:hypothetical protein [Flavisolibacter sp.]MBD0377271.1 hypothetical protein [Flavisolibacter sp.]